METFSILILFGWGMTVLVAAHLGGQRNAGGTGFLLGFMFGPIGMLAAGLLDGRPNCRRCGGRQNVKPSGQRYSVCEHCGSQNVASSSSTVPSSFDCQLLALESYRATESITNQEVGSSSRALPPQWSADTIPSFEDDPVWQSSLNEAKRQLESAGLIGSK